MLYPFNAYLDRSPDGYLVLSSSAAVLLKDSFTDANGTALTAHTMDRGAGWTQLQGSFDIQSNAAHGNTAATQNRATADSSKTDVTISAVGFSPTINTRLGLLARSADATHEYEGYWDGNAGSVQIYENNFATQRASVPLTYVAGKSWLLSLKTSGTKITFTVTQADNPANTATASFGSMAVNLTNTRCGILMFGNEAGGFVDNFQVTGP